MKSKYDLIGVFPHRKVGSLLSVPDFALSFVLFKSLQQKSIIRSLLLSVPLEFHGFEFTVQRANKASEIC